MNSDLFSSTSLLQNDIYRLNRRCTLLGMGLAAAAVMIYNLRRNGKALAKRVEELEKQVNRSEEDA